MLASHVQGMKFLLIYGSQTGQSEAIAEQIASLSEEQGLEAELVCGEDVNLDTLNNQVICDTLYTSIVFTCVT